MTGRDFARARRRRKVMAWYRGAFYQRPSVYAWRADETRLKGDVLSFSAVAEPVVAR